MDELAAHLWEQFLTSGKSGDEEERTHVRQQCPQPPEPLGAFVSSCNLKHPQSGLKLDLGLC